MRLVNLNEVSCDRAINTDTNGEKDLWCSSTVQLLSTDVNGRICDTLASIYYITVKIKDVSCMTPFSIIKYWNYSYLLGRHFKS